MAFRYMYNIHLFTVSRCLFDLVALHTTFAGCFEGVMGSYFVRINAVHNLYVKCYLNPNQQDYIYIKKNPKSFRRITLQQREVSVNVNYPPPPKEKFYEMCSDCICKEKCSCHASILESNIC